MDNQAREGEITDEMREWFKDLKRSWSLSCRFDDCKTITCDCEKMIGECQNPTIWIVEHYPHRAQPRQVSADDKAAMEADRRQHCEAYLNQYAWNRPNVELIQQGFESGYWYGNKFATAHVIDKVLGIIEGERLPITQMAVSADYFHEALDDIKSAIEAMREGK